MTFHRKTAAEARPGVGRDTEAWCSRCNMTLTHTIVAMVGLVIVRAKCNTCGAEHAFKTARDAAAPAPRSSASRQPTGRTIAAAQPPSNATRLLWERAMGDRDRSHALSYPLPRPPAPGELISHKQFGYGIVDLLIEGKVKVLFADGYKWLAAVVPG